MYLQVKGFNPMSSIQSSSYKASLRSKIAVRADELYPGDSMDAIKERMSFTRKMYKMIMEEKNIDLFWFFPLFNINLFFQNDTLRSLLSPR